MLRLERERLVEVGVEIGGALAGDAVDQIERDVVKAGSAESVTARRDVVRARPTLEHVEQAAAGSSARRARRGHTALAQEGGQRRA